MQEQIKRAMAAGASSPAGADDAAAAGGLPGKRILAAMIKAREGGCDCEPCRLLADELNDALAGFLQSADAPAATAPDDIERAPAEQTA